MSRYLVMAAGGTGGHMFPAQALAETMLAKGWRVAIMTDARGARHTGAFPTEVEIREMPSATFARGGVLAKALVPLTVARGVLAARRDMAADRPDVVVGFGGYPAIPALGAAYWMGLPRMIHEANGVLGRVNQLFVKRVSVVACGTWPTELPEGVEGVHVGTPVRASVLDRAGAPYIPPGDYPMSILVFGGSQGARVLSDVVPAAIAGLPHDLRGRLRISHQARAEDDARVKAVYADAGIQAEVQPFFADLPARLADCQLTISRSGASSVADISVIGRPSILIPLGQAIRDEQTANARCLVDAGAAILIPESVLKPVNLTEQITSVLTQPEAAVKMAHAALAYSVTDAAERLAEMVEQLSEMKQ